MVEHGFRKAGVMGSSPVIGSWSKENEVNKFKGKAMNNRFRSLFKGLDKKFQRLIKMRPCTIATVLDSCPEGGVYLFTENNKHIYAGRTKKKIKSRLREHLRKPKSAVFIWRLMCGKEPYRKDWRSHSNFKKKFELAKNRIKNMDVRFIDESNSARRALLEIYVAVGSSAKYNDFNEH